MLLGVRREGILTQRWLPRKLCLVPVVRSKACKYRALRGAAGRDTNSKVVAAEALLGASGTIQSVYISCSEGCAGKGY